MTGSLAFYKGGGREKKRGEVEGNGHTGGRNGYARDSELTILQDMHTYHVYIMASRSRILYVGVTNDLARRVNEHKQGLIPGFTSKYRISRLVYFESFTHIRDAIAREKAIKGWKRSRKVGLIEARNLLGKIWLTLSLPPISLLSSYKSAPTCHPERSAPEARGAKDLLWGSRKQVPHFAR
jgi:putative endonuclease